MQTQVIHGWLSLTTAIRSLVGTLPILVVAMPGCAPENERRESPARVVVYCSVDEAFGRAILGAFAPPDNLIIEPVFDSEAGKTTGLIERIIAESESGRPRGTVLFSSEVFNTIRLARRGLLEPYDPPAAGDIPPSFRDPEHRWTGLAARGRVLAFDPTRTAAGDLPRRWEDLAEPRFASVTAIANPLFGTTRGHVAAMFALWGPERGRAFLTALRDNGVTMLDGNSSAVRALIAGRVDFAMTDTDDVWVAQRTGASLDMRYLDMGDGGTLMIPCTVALIKGGPHTDQARALVDYLVSAATERALAMSDSRNVPVRKALREELGMDWPASTSISFDKVADAMPGAVQAAREILIR